MIRTKRIAIITTITILLLSNVVYGTTELTSKYNLRDHITIDIKDQKTTNSCWTMPVATAVETNIELRNNKNVQISTRHMDYATSQSISGNTYNEYGYNREANTTGTASWGLAYLTNGRGPIFESEMSFSESFGRTNLAQIMNKIPIVQVDDWVMFPRIFKNITEGQLVYKNERQETYTEAQIQEIRKKIKQHIITNGAITTEIYIDGINQYYNSATAAYYCNDANQTTDHGLAIIGWDDNYSKENFKQSCRPQNDGAYLVQNSYGTENEIPSTFYVSYDDVNIEKSLYGIEKTSELDYQRVYQHDELGRNFSFSTENSQLYGANVFTRENREGEYLQEISIATYCDMNYEIYVNSEDGEINSQKLVKVLESTTPITNGYHTIKLPEPILLTGEKFVVAVKYKGVEETQITTQAKIDYAGTKSPYENISNNAGESYYGASLDNMKDMYGVTELKNSNLCIKAFTTYSITKGDTNLDKKLTALDISRIKILIVDLIVLELDELTSADMNNDSKLTAVDLSMLKEKIVNS